MTVFKKQTMMTNEFVLSGGTMVDSSSDGTPTDLLIRNGKIAAHLAPGTPVDASIPVRSAQGLHLFPGLRVESLKAPRSAKARSEKRKGEVGRGEGGERAQAGSWQARSPQPGCQKARGKGEREAAGKRKE